MPEGLSPFEVGKELHEHSKEPQEQGAAGAATGIRASSRLARRCCSRWSRSRPPGRAMPRPSGGPSPASSSPTQRRCATWPPAPTLPPCRPATSTRHLQHLVHRLHVERPPEAGGRRAALPARVQGRLRRLDGDRPVPQPACRAWAHLRAPVQARRPGQGGRAGPRGRSGGGGGRPLGGGGRRVRPDHGIPGRGAVPVGIGSTFRLPTVRYVLIVVGAVLLILATALILTQPGLPA
jgi:hypothetical protein